MKLLISSVVIALKSIAGNKLRNSLTVLGIVLGVFTISTLLSLAFGVREEVTKQIEDLGSNLIAVVPGKLNASGGGFNPSASLGASTLTEKDFDSIEQQLPEIKNLSMAMLVSGTVKVSDKVSSSSLIFAASEKILPNLNTSIESGRFFDNVEIEENSKVVVLGSKVKEMLFVSDNALGKELEIRGHKFQVIGILKSKETSSTLFGPNLDDLVIMPITTGWKITDTKQIFRMMMHSPTTEQADEYKSKVKDIILNNHGGEEDFSVVTQEEILGVVGDILDILTAMIGAIATLSLVIGGLGVMNIMLVSISERTREIGIRKAVGANNAHIMVQFLVEAIVLSFIGGLIGSSLSGIVAVVVSTLSPIKLVFSPFVVLVSIGFSVLVGVIFGVAPALSAARKDPIKAIRSE